MAEGIVSTLHSMDQIKHPPHLPDMSASRRSLDDLLLYRLSRLLAVAGSLVIRLCEGRFGITRREWRLIATLACHGELNSSQLADHAQLDRARTSKAIGSLVDKGLASRAVPPGDRRQVRIALTPAGLVLYDELHPLVTRINADLVDALQADDLERLDRMLEHLQARATRMVGTAVLPKADRGRRGARPPG
jgi:DNA-binding MarR family transcriptional regulator